MIRIRPAFQWFFLALLAVVLNMALMAVLPLLRSRVHAVRPYLQARPIQTVRIKPQEPPVQEKRMEKRTENQRSKKPRPLNHPAVAQTVKPAPPALGFDVSPRLPHSRPMLSGLSIQRLNLPRPALNGIYAVDELDAPLTPIAQAPPVYPLRARRQGIEGWVKVSFVVMPDGRVADIHIVDADPAAVFENCVRQCIAKWRFSPGTIQGEPVKVRAETTMRFDLKG